MYCNYFGFREKPFTITPNPRFVFLSKNHREAFAHLLYGIDNHAGFIVLTGEVGTGKTTVLRTLMEKLDDDRYRTALIFNPSLSALELLRSINHEYALPAEGLDNAELLAHLNRFLLEENSAGRTVVLVIDEAQNLAPRTLEQIRLISNLETDTDKLIQIVLAGQPELDHLMARPELRQLAQRVGVRYHLLPLDFEDTRAYVNHRVAVAGGKGAAGFSRGALQRIFRRAGGVPRLINIACDRALLIGYTDEKREISTSMAKKAIREVGEFGKSVWPKKWFRKKSTLQKERLRRKPAWQRQQRRRAWLCLLAVVIVGGLFAAYYRSPVKSAATDDFMSAVRWELKSVEGSASAVRAFNVLAKRWHVREATGNMKLSLPGDLERIAGERGLRLTSMTTDLATLRRLDLPALLELDLAGLEGKRYLALTEITDGKVSVSPPLLGKSSFSEADLKRFWSGRVYVPWKDFDQLAQAAAPGARREEVLRLQNLLATEKVYRSTPTGVYDEGTVNAIKEFQQSRGIPVNGRAEGTTLLLLYREAGRYDMPRLTGKGDGQKR